MNALRLPFRVRPSVRIWICLALGFSAAAAEKHPNIIVILTDDLGYADVGAKGQERDVRMPNLDRMAAEGVRCTAGYVTSPRCLPSRAGLLTGRYQQRLGIDTIPDMPLPLGAVTIPERLKAAGYTSGQVGKWHREPNALAGLPADAQLDGVDLIPHLTGQRADAPHAALFWRFWSPAAIRDGRWKLLYKAGEPDRLFDLKTTNTNAEISPSNNTI